MKTYPETMTSPDMTVEEFAATVGMHPDSVRRLIRQHVISAYVVNPQARKPRYRITPAALTAFQGQSLNPSSPPQVAEERPRPGSDAWLTVLHSMGQHREPVGLSDEVLSRETLYGDDLR